MWMPLLALVASLPPVQDAPSVAARPSLADGARANDRLAQMRRSPAPKTTAAVASVLRRFVEGTRSPNVVDTAVARRLARTPGAKQAARRILERLDRLAPAAKAAAFGDHSTRDAITAAGWTQAMSAGAGLVTGGVGLTPADVLPAELPQYPAAFTLELAGVASTAASDPDGTDELVVMSTFVRAVSNSAYSVTTHGAPQDGAIEGMGTDTIVPQSIELVATADGYNPAVLISAAFEADGDDVARRQEYATMLGLAETLGLQAEGPATVEDFLFGLDYTMTLLQLSDPARWPAGTLQRTVLVADTAVMQLWATPPALVGGVEWKVKHVHTIGAATYTAYYDVPATGLADANVQVQLLQVASLTGVDPGADADDLVVRVAIGDADLGKVLAADDDTPPISWAVKRKIRDAPRPITIEVFDRSPGLPAGFYDPPGPAPVSACGGDYSPCPPIEVPLVLRGAADTRLDITYDPATGKLSGDVTGDRGDTIIVQGSGGKRGKVKLRVTAPGG